MPELALTYWDACVFLSYINGERDGRPDIDALLNRSGVEFQIVTSALSIVEVASARVEQDAKALDEEIGKKINALWESSKIHVVEFYPLLAHEARALMRQAVERSVKLKPMDAMHLATARRINATRFHLRHGVSQNGPGSTLHDRARSGRAAGIAALALPTGLR
jgi:predicted nucleic acid-binding protein